MNSVSLPVDWALEKLLASSPKAQFAGDDVDGVQVAAWSLQRRCSLTPQQLGTGYACLVLASALVAAVFWLQGVRMVALFSTFEVLTVGLAFAWHAMHAADGEQLLMQDDHLWVEQRRGFQMRCQRLPLSSLRVIAGKDAIELRVGASTCPVGCLVDHRRRDRYRRGPRQLRPANAFDLHSRP